MTVPRASSYFISVALLLSQIITIITAQCNDISSGSQHWDLSSISGRDFRAPYQVGRFTYTMQFRVCGNIAEGCPLPFGAGSPRCAMPNTGAVCQRTGSRNYCLGVFNGTIDVQEYRGAVGNGVMLSYYNGDFCDGCSGDPNRNTAVVIICAEGVSGDPSDILVEPYVPPSSRTTISFRHQAGCVKYLSAGDGLTVGGVMLIILFVVVAVYFVGGILFNKYYRKMEGREVVPNVTFWASLPGLVKDGAMFIVNKIRGREGSYSQLPQEEY